MRKIKDLKFKLRTFYKYQFSKASNSSGMSARVFNFLIPILGLCAIKLDSQEVLTAFTIAILIGLCFIVLFAILSWDT